MIKIYKSATILGESVKLVFQITQHSRDEELMKSLVSYFKCGRYAYRSKENEALGDFIVTKFEDILKIISFFENYPIIGVKALDFADWCKAAELMKKGAHLTSEGLEKIKKIKIGMNRGKKEV